MECNKEEAERAKGIAENKMHNRDFFGAQKIVLKAQQLFPELENVSQMLTVCEVHCAAGTKVNGETDWYGVLQVDPTADDSVIRKQYRKLALLLHPDKNKFGGAEAAFKLVGEAHRTLTDRDKRSLHDLKRRVGFRTVSMRPVPPKNSAPPQFNGVNKSKTPSESSSQTFWTVCPFCGMRYQYYQTIMNRALRCQSCMKTFVAYDLNAQPVASAAAWNRAGKPHPEKPFPNAYYGGPKSNIGTAAGMAFRENVSKGSTVSEPSTGAGMGTNVKKDATMEKESGAGNDEKFEKVKLPEAKRREQAAKPSAGHGSQKRGRKLMVECSDSESSDSDVATAYHRPVEQAVPGGSTRRSTRQKQNVSYKENRDDYDDDFVAPISKRLKREGISTNTRQRNEEFDDGKANGEEHDAAISRNKNNEGEKETLSKTLPNGSHDVQHDAGKQKRDLHTDATDEFSSTASPVPEVFSYPDPEFCDFGKERDESKFAAGQIWAAYDETDAMPRYYAWIRQVYSPKFNLKFTWLEYDPATKDESTWYEGDLPVCCGSYKLGKSEITDDCLMFSHLMHWKKGIKRNSFQIYPRKTEVWAIFKDWNIDWVIHDKRDYEYVVVEILSDFTEGDEITAVRLVKIQEFVGLFVKSTDKLTASLKLRACDILQFSHKIPSHRLTGNERQDIPKGSLELDCASLPPNFAATYPSVSLESIKVTVVDLDGTFSDPSSDAKEEFRTSTANNSSFGSSSKIPREEVQSKACYAASEPRKHAESDESAPKQQEGTTENTIHAQDLKSNGNDRQSQSQPLSANISAYEYPDSEFHDFERGRSTAKFEQGQVWALYSDIDTYPKYYGLTTKVEVDLENFKVHVRWLEGFSDREEDRKWFEKRLPAGCGTFKITKEFAEFDSPDTFSHLLQAKPMPGTKHYVIYPTVGEIWALYQNWSPRWSHSDLKTCVFSVVEILASDNSGFKVSALAKVNGYRFVFKPQKGSGSELCIPFAEHLKFSHQIPAFRLTEERGGKLRGYWELDPASMPDLLLCSP